METQGRQRRPAPGGRSSCGYTFINELLPHRRNVPMCCFDPHTRQRGRADQLVAPVAPRGLTAQIQVISINMFNSKGHNHQSCRRSSCFKGQLQSNLNSRPLPAFKASFIYFCERKLQMAKMYFLNLFKSLWGDYCWTAAHR